MTDSTHLNFFYKQQGYRICKETRIGLRYINHNYKECTLYLYIHMTNLTSKHTEIACYFLKIILEFQCSVV
jgi:hypothetical protein